MIALHKATDAAGFANLSKSANLASRTFRDAAASTGMFEVQQLRLNSATDDYIKKMKAQKMSFRDMIKQRKVANAAYKEQLQMENMSLRRNPASSRSNKGVYDVIIPKDVSADVDTARKRLAFFNAELKSGAHQMVNWGKNTQWAGRQLMVGFTMPIAAFGAAAGVMAYQIDKELTRIAKVIDTTATTSMGIEKELAQVRTEGLKTATVAAKEYGSAATDTLNVQAELAATGLMGAELQKSTQEVMRIARLGEVDNDTAIQATISLQSVFSDTIKTSQDLSDAFNYMNSIENATSLSTADFATAIPVAASSVKAFGGDVKELGILLTAMKENGIGASEGANALKATMQRLGRPSKQIREEWSAITGTDITQLVDSSDGLMEIFTKINAATANLSDPEKRDAFAGLFGSYQVSKMMALTTGMGKLQDGIGQVSKAYEISNQSAEQWADTAATEVERYQKSISGMWDSAFQSMKIELAEVGEPFVILGTKIVQGISKILKAFNDFPNAIKYLVAAGVAATALAGAVLMLTGLFANLTGNAIKVGSSIAGLVLKMNILDKESKAGLMVSEMASKAATHQMDAVQMLTAQIEKQTAAQRESNQVMAQAYNIPMGGKGGVGSPMLSPGAQNMMNQQNRLAYEQSIRDRYKAQGPSGKVYNRDPDSASPWMQVSNSRVDEMVMRDLQTEAIDMNDAINRTTKEAADLDNQRVKAAERRNRLQKQAGAFMAVESAALAASLISDNKMVDNAAQIVMFAGLMGPAFAVAVPIVKTIGANMVVAAKAAQAGAIAARAQAGGLAASAVAAGGLGRGLVAARGAMLAIMGPVGWTVTALGALAAIVYKVAQSQKEARAAAIAEQKELNSLAKDYATAAGRTVREYKTLRNVMLDMKTEREQKQYDEDLDYFKDTSAEGGSKKVDAFKNLETDAQRATYAQQMFVDLQIKSGMSAMEASTAIKALYAAAGSGAEEANAAASELRTTLGAIGDEDWENILTSEREKIIGGLGDTLAVTDEDVTRVAGLFSEALSEADTAEEAAIIMEEFENIVAVGWQKVWADVISGNALAMDALKRNGIESMDELQAWWNTASETDKFQLFQREDGLGQITGSEAWVTQLNEAAGLESKFVREYASEFGQLGGEVEHFAQLMDDINVKTKTLDFGEAEQEIQNIVAATQAQGARGAEMSDEAARLSINAFNAAHGFEEGSTKAEALYNWMNRVKAETGGAASATGGITRGLVAAAGAASNLRSLLAGISKADLSAIGKEVTQDLQNQMADNWTDQLDSQQEAESQANSDYWDAQKDAQGDRFDAQSDALSEQHDREQKGMENAWDAKREGLENYWDKRIEAVDNAIEHEEKAEEKRQKMFDAEIARINKMADMANTKIDFNVALNEGNLDEAAKIANTAMASDAQSVFEREREKGAEKSAARVDRLGKKSESLGEQKDAAMEAFSKREEAAKAHLSKMQEMESESLQKRQDMERDSLEKRAEANKAALDKRHEQEAENLDRILKTFLATVPTTKKALQNQVKALGEDLAKFGINILDPMSKQWGRWYKNNMHDGILDGLKEAMSDEAWAESAKLAKDKMMDGWGFKSEKEYTDFINGDSGGGDALYGADKNRTLAAAGKTGPQTSKHPTKTPPSQHTGGLVGSGVDNRYGVAKNYAGQHPSETLINAQKGEYIINRDAAKKFGPELDSINAGRGVGGKYGIAGRLGGMFVGSMNRGLQKIGNKNLRKAQSAAAAMGPGAAGSGSFSASGYVPGQGGWARPSTPGLGWSNTHDYRAPIGTPVYATSSGTITDSRAITSGGSPGNGGVTPNGVPYRSYGEHIQLAMADGNRMNFGHLSARYVGAGQHVEGGALIGRTGNTGNSSGPHLHMDIGGNENASGYLASRGIALRKGAQYVKFDNTAANLHRGESVLTKRLTEQMHEGVERFANGDNSEYNVTVHINGYSGDADELARKVEKVFDRKARRRPSSRKVGKG